MPLRSLRFESYELLNLKRIYECAQSPMRISWQNLEKCHSERSA